MDVVIEEITPDSVTVMRQEKDDAVTETIPISDIATIKKASVKKIEQDLEGADWYRRGRRRARHRGAGVLRGGCFFQSEPPSTAGAAH